MSYELTIVCKDGSRVNLLDHRWRKRLQADAQSICEFLDVPLWDMSVV